MAIVNVAKNVAVPQAESGNGFIFVLKADRNSMGSRKQ